MKVVGYARVSTELQKERETIKTQQEAIKEYCEKRGLDLVSMYSDEDVFSGTLLGERPQGKRLMEAARRHEFEAVVVYKSDRLGRDSFVNATILKEIYKDLGILIFGTAENIDLTTSDGQMMFTIASALASKEREDTLRRSNDATVRLAKEGVWLGGIVPFGYRTTGKDREARLIPATDTISSLGKSEADVVRWIYELSANEGLSCIQIAARLNAYGIPTSYIRDGREVVTNKRQHKTRGVWSAGRVRNMLVETTYKGVHLWGKRGSKRRPKNSTREVIAREVPALVDEVTWQRAQDTLTKNRMLRPDVEKRRYLLRGLIKCAHCGLTYCGTAHKGASASNLSPIPSFAKSR